MSPRHAENHARLEANRQVVRGFCATINRRRVERLGEFMTGDVGTASGLPRGLPCQAGYATKVSYGPTAGLEAR